MEELESANDYETEENDKGLKDTIYMLLAVDDVWENNGTLSKVMQIIFSRRIRRVKMKSEDEE